MAKGDKDEHRMLFDIRGKRRNVVKVVYGILALLMGLSLLLVAGPLPFGDIFGSEDAQEQASQQFEDQIDRIEVKLAKEPEDPTLLLALTKAHVSAGNSLAEFDSATGQTAITLEARQQYEEASSVWSEYLEATEEPSPAGAAQMARTLFSLAETATRSSEAAANVKAAAEAQAIVAEQQPSINSLGTLAIYRSFTFDYAGAKEANDEAKKFATSKFQRQQLEDQLDEYLKLAKNFEGQLKEEERFEQASREGQGGGAAGQPSGNPFGSGVGGTTLSE